MRADEYSAKLVQLETLDPGCLLLRKLRGGPSVVNELLLANALRKAKEADRTDRSTQQMEESTDPVGDAKLKAMRGEQSRLFAERAALSNRFHDCKTNEERAHLSEDIQVVQRNLERVFRKIREYKVHGTISEENSKYYVPKDGLALAKKQNSLRANISRKQKEVNELRSGNLADPATLRKVEQQENKLTELKMMLANVNQKIKDIQ